jgi:hypothetical protein
MTRPPPLEEKRSMIDDIEEITHYQVTAGG